MKRINECSQSYNDLVSTEVPLDMSLRWLFEYESSFLVDLKLKPELALVVKDPWSSSAYVSWDWYFCDLFHVNIDFIHDPADWNAVLQYVIGAIT